MVERTNSFKPNKHVKIKIWRGNWDKNAIESSFMPLDH